MVMFPKNLFSSCDDYMVKLDDYCKLHYDYQDYTSILEAEEARLRSKYGWKEIDDLQSAYARERAAAFEVGFMLGLRDGMTCNASIESAKESK